MLSRKVGFYTRIACVQRILKDLFIKRYHFSILKRFPLSKIKSRYNNGLLIREISLLESVSRLRQ